MATMTTIIRTPADPFDALWLSALDGDFGNLSTDSHARVGNATHGKYPNPEKAFSNIGILTRAVAYGN
eukprot:574647-Karenia_brevis.AAC.1